MADNVELNAGTGGAILATDDVVGVQFQKVKLDVGGDGATAPLSNANPLPVSDAGGSLTVDGTVELGAASLAALETINAAQSGAWNVTNISGTVSLPTGASTAAKQPALGTAGAASADVITVQGIASMTKLLVTPDSVALPANQSVNVSQVAGTTADTNSGTKSAGTLRVVIATDQPALTNKLLVTPDSVALPANQSVNNSQINGVTPLMGNGVTGTGSQRVTIASDNTAFSVNATVTGPAAHDAAISGNPVRLAGRALTADYTAVAAGDTADLITTLLGKLVTIPYANPANTWSYAAASGGIVNTTGVTAKAAGAAGVRNYVTHVDVVNGHATIDTDVQIRDGAAGTVLWRGFAKAAGGGVSASFDPPLRGTAATLVEVACGTTGTATYFNLQGFSAAE